LRCPSNFTIFTIQTYPTHPFFPGLNWYEVLLNPYASWHGASTAVTGFGMMVQPYLVTAGFVLLLLVMAAA
jgi:hypothetical protein